MLNSRFIAPLREEIAARAQLLWQLDNTPVGRDLEFWQAAEAEVYHERDETARAAERSRRVPPPIPAGIAPPPVSQPPIQHSAPRPLCGFRPYEPLHTPWHYSTCL